MEVGVTGWMSISPYITWLYLTHSIMRFHDFLHSREVKPWETSRSLVGTGLEWESRQMRPLYDVWDVALRDDEGQMWGGDPSAPSTLKSSKMQIRPLRVHAKLDAARAGRRLSERSASRPGADAMEVRGWLLRKSVKVCAVSAPPHPQHTHTHTPGHITCVWCELFRQCDRYTPRVPILEVLRSVSSTPKSKFLLISFHHRLTGT